MSEENKNNGEWFLVRSWGGDVLKDVENVGVPTKVTEKCVFFGKSRNAISSQGCYYFDSLEKAVSAAEEINCKKLDLSIYSLGSSAVIFEEKQKKANEFRKKYGLPEKEIISSIEVVKKATEKPKGL
jgi:hypothetical protein